MAKVKVEAQFWTNKCLVNNQNEVASCDIPQALGEVVTSKLTWNDTSKPGNVTRAHKELAATTLKEFGRITIYNVYPMPELNQPKYYQVRFEWIQPARAWCLQSVRAKDPIELPPLICSAWNAVENKMYGVTLQFSAEK